MRISNHLLSNSSINFKPNSAPEYLYLYAEEEYLNQSRPEIQSEEIPKIIIIDLFPSDEK